VTGFMQVYALTHRKSTVDDTLRLVTEFKLCLSLLLLFALAYFPWIIALEYNAGPGGDGELGTVKPWMRINHVLLLLVTALFSTVVAKPLWEVRRHTQAHTLAHLVAAGVVYDARAARWTAASAPRGGGGRPGVGAHGVTKLNVKS